MPLEGETVSNISDYAYYVKKEWLNVDVSFFLI